MVKVTTVYPEVAEFAIHVDSLLCVHQEDKGSSWKKEPAANIQFDINAIVGALAEHVYHIAPLDPERVQHLCVKLGAYAMFMYDTLGKGVRNG